MADGDIGLWHLIRACGIQSINHFHRCHRWQWWKVQCIGHTDVRKEGVLRQTLLQRTCRLFFRGLSISVYSLRTHSMFSRCLLNDSAYVPTGKRRVGIPEKNRSTSISLYFSSMLVAEIKWLVWHMWFCCWDWGSANNSCCATGDVSCWRLNFGTLFEVGCQRRCWRELFQIILSMTSIPLQEADQAMRVEEFDLAHHVCFPLLIVISNELPPSFCIEIWAASPLVPWSDVVVRPSGDSCHDGEVFESTALLPEYVAVFNWIDEKWWISICSQLKTRYIWIDRVTTRKWFVSLSC